MKLKLYPHQKKEIWKDIKGYEGLYQVSNYGRVRSLDRIIVDNWCTREFKGKMLNPTEHNGKQPYLYVSLSKPCNFYKPIRNHELDQERALKRLKSLDKATRLGIAEKYKVEGIVDEE